jgi:hypothetical protein
MPSPRACVCAHLYARGASAWILLIMAREFCAAIIAGIVARIYYSGRSRLRPDLRGICLSLSETDRLRPCSRHQNIWKLWRANFAPRLSPELSPGFIVQGEAACDRICAAPASPLRETDHR